MDEYSPLKRPNTQAWFDLDETERIWLVREYHQRAGEQLSEDALEMHSIIHVVVESQIAMAVEPVERTLDRLIRQGLDRHEAIHAIGTVVSADIYELIKHKTTQFSHSSYRRKLEKLTAKRWRKGKL